MTGKETKYVELIKLFAFVLHQVRLYTENHPSAQQAAQNFSMKLRETLSSEGNLTFGFVEKLLIMNDCSFDNKTAGVVALLSECRRLEVEKLIFERGLGGDEISTLLTLVAESGKTPQGKGEFKKAFEKSKFRHIRIGAARHLLVDEE